MSAQLTLQAPIALPPEQVSSYLDQLWQQDLEGPAGAATFTLVVWEGSWLEQHLVRCGRVDGPITGLVSPQLLNAARNCVVDCDLPLSTAPLDPKLAWRLGEWQGNHQAEDLRGQFVSGAISAYMPRRLLTLAPHPRCLPAAGNPGGRLLPPARGWQRRFCLRRRGGVAGRHGGPAGGFGSDPALDSR